jgi:single-stranded DNA-binding protein
MTNAIYVRGKLIGNPKISETKKGRPMVKVLVEIEQLRPVGRGEFKMELHQIPILAFSRCAEELRALPPGAEVVVDCHLSGTRYEEPGGEVRHGIQLVADAVSYPKPYRAPVPELHA